VARKYVGTWEGGRIAGLKKNRRRWLLERTFLGKQHTLPLSAATEDEARAALYLWHQDPAGFLERHQEKRRRDAGQLQVACLLNQALLDALAADMKRRRLGAQHQRDTLAYLATWRQDLGAVDLRHVTRLQVQRVLDSHATARKNRIIAFKVLGAFLRASGRIDPAQDPARHVQVPTPRPERSVRTKRYSAEQLAAAYARVSDQGCRDAMRLAVCYGMHASEVQRIGRGAARLRRVEGAGEIAGVVSFVHKSSALHAISLDAPAYAAAARLQGAGAAPSYHVMLDAFHPLKPGEFRHSYVTLGQRGRIAYPAGVGVSVEALVAVTGHRSSGTARKYYDGEQTPQMVVLPLALRHPADPAVVAPVPTAPAAPKPTRKRKAVVASGR
jgi:hypothetical protein